jgi:hypothetical protein
MFNVLCLMFKEIENMKALRYLLIIMSLVSVLNVSAQMPNQSEWGKQPVVQMQSTSVMAGSGSALPQAAATGTVVTGSTPGTFSSSSVHGGIRRIGGSGSGTGGNEAQENENPWETPIGDVLWPLMLMAMAYVVYLTSRKKKEIS